MSNKDGDNGWIQGWKTGKTDTHIIRIWIKNVKTVKMDGYMDDAGRKSTNVDT